MTEEKFLKIYHQYYRLVKSVVFSVLKDADFAEDVCQEVFLLFAEKEGTVQEEYYQRWFSVNAKRKAIDFCRKSCQVHEIAAEIPVEVKEIHKKNGRRYPNTNSKNCFEDGLTHKIALQELTGRLFEDLAKKDSVWCEIMMRIYIEDEDSEEVARALGISTGTLRTKKHRIKNWINEHYREEFENF